MLNGTQAEGPVHRAEGAEEYGLELGCKQAEQNQAESNQPTAAGFCHSVDFTRSRLVITHKF